MLALEGETFLNNHRGPYRLQLIRPFATKPGFFRSEWLSGVTDSDDVADEALGYLTDPRDNVVSVFVWSQAENQFVGGYRRV